MGKTSPPAIFLDANIIFSAAYSSEGNAAALFALARKNMCRLVSSKYAIEEARRNLEYKKPDALKVFQTLLAQIDSCPEADAGRLEKASAIGLDTGDAPILAAALGNADFLVTGDRKHFGAWMGKPVHGIKILSLSDALDKLLNK